MIFRKPSKKLQKVMLSQLVLQETIQSKQFQLNQSIICSEIKGIQISFHQRPSKKQKKLQSFAAKKMGCCTAVVEQPSKIQSKQLQPARDEFIVTKTDYINYLLDHILSNIPLTSILHKSIFEQLKTDFNSHYWPDDKKTTFIRLIEDYMNYTLALISEESTNKTKYHEDVTFGEMFGRDMHKLENQVKMRDHWLLETLNFSENFFSLKFDLRDNEEIFKMASDVKFLCEKEMLAMFYLSSYLRKSCQKLRQEGLPIPQILSTLRQKAIMLKNQYGVKGTRQKQQAYISRDSEIEQMRKIKSFNLKPEQIKIVFTTQKSKQEQLEDQVIKMVNLAKKNFNFFNSLLYLPCTENEGFGFKSNLKLTSRQNKSSLLRVKQKLLKKQIDKLASTKNKNDIPQIKNCETLQQRVKAEGEYVKGLMQQIYQQITQVQFNVSDLLRGKCLFNKVAHINQAANAIIQKIEQQEKSGKDVRLVQIDNRFEKNTKDLVLKIKIGDIISQFQMVLFFKQAENQIDHKMYQIQRSKILSQISILSDWDTKISKEYFSLLSRILPFTGDQQIANKCKKLMQFLGMDPQQFKQQTQERQFNTKMAAVLLASNSAKIQQQKLKHAGKSCKLRSLQYWIQQKKQQKALHLYELPQLKCTDEFVISCELNCIGSVYKSMNKSQEALRYYLQSLEIKKKMKGQQSIDCAQVLNNIGLVYFNMKEYENALNYYDKSLKIKQQARGIDSIDCAQAFNNIGLAYDRLKKFQEALKYYNKSLAIKETVKGKDSIDCAQILGNIGLVYNSMGKNAEAIDCFSRALTIKEKQTGKDSMDCAQTLNNLGGVYKKMEKFTEALSYYSRSLAIKAKIKGDSMQNAQTLASIGSVYQCMKDYQKAIDYYSRSLDIKKKIKGQYNEQCVQLTKVIDSLTTKITVSALDPNQINLEIPIMKASPRADPSGKYQLKTQENDEPERNVEPNNQTEKQDAM